MLYIIEDPTIPIKLSPQSTNTPSSIRRMGSDTTLVGFIGVSCQYGMQG
jgi:hypothetical protein